MYRSTTQWDAHLRKGSHIVKEGLIFADYSSLAQGESWYKTIVLTDVGIRRSKLGVSAILRIFEL